MSSSDIFIGETIGTAILILLGGGVCAAVTLKASKARNAGWVAIAFGWGFAVMTAAYISAPLSGAHLNPAVTLGLWALGRVSPRDVAGYVPPQLAGGRRRRAPRPEGGHPRSLPPPCPSTMWAKLRVSNPGLNLRSPSRAEHDPRR